MLTTIFESEELTAIEQKIWILLLEGVKSYKNPFHYGTLANIQDGLPELRTVILRKVLEEEKKLFFHTDIRSPKVNFLRKKNSISWLFYDEGLRLQIRMQGSSLIHFNNEIAAVGWQDSRINSQLTYSILHAPGSILEAPIPIDINEKNPSPDVIEFSASNFAVVETHIEKVDIVFLHHQGNKRAIFDYTNASFNWVQA